MREGRCSQVCRWPVERFTDELDARTATALHLRRFLLCGRAERASADYARLAGAAGLEAATARPLRHGLGSLTLISR